MVQRNVRDPRLAMGAMGMRRRMLRKTEKEMAHRRPGRCCEAAQFFAIADNIGTEGAP